MTKSENRRELAIAGELLARSITDDQLQRIRDEKLVPEEAIQALEQLRAACAERKVHP